MRTSLLRRSLVLVALAASASVAAAQSPSFYSEMHWREIGPTRAGRARALDGVPSEPNVFYIGYDNGGVWRTTDYGSTWHPIFDEEPTGSIGAIGVAPSDPSIIYVGSGAGIIRPDLSTGDGMYKSTDAGRTWTHLGLRNTQMIAQIAVDPTNPERLFVAALGHPYGPNEERGIFRSTDGGKTFQKVLYKDEYTSGNDVRIDPKDPNTVYATLWQQQQGFYENGAFGGAGNGVFKSTDGGNTWTQLTDGLPSVIQANLAIAPSNPNIIYAMAAGAGEGGRGGRGNSTTGVVGFYRSNDAGAHWHLAIDDPSVAAGARPQRPRPASAGPHRRRRPADDHRRPQEPERGLQRLDRHVAHRGRRAHLDRRARRPGRRRLPEGLDQPQPFEHHPRRGRPGRRGRPPTAGNRGATGTRSPRPPCIT